MVGNNENVIWRRKSSILLDSNLTYPCPPQQWLRVIYKILDSDNSSVWTCSSERSYSSRKRGRFLGTVPRYNKRVGRKSIEFLGAEHLCSCVQASNHGRTSCKLLTEPVWSGNLERSKYLNRDYPLNSCAEWILAQKDMNLGTPTFCLQLFKATLVPLVLFLTNVKIIKKNAPSVLNVVIGF